MIKGGNDAGALKTAHAGISLSDQESQVVAHFSSSNKSILCCVDLLLEARCSLDTSFAAYKYLLIYGHTTAIVGLIQYFFSVNMSQATWYTIFDF
jgi:cation-transporting ATPase 13A2